MTGYKYTFEFFIDLGQLIVSFFAGFFDFIFKDVWSIITETVEAGELPSWVVDSLQSINFDEVLASFSMAGLLFSTAVITLLIIYAFIP